MVSEALKSVIKNVIKDLENRSKGWTSDDILIQLELLNRSQQSTILSLEFNKAAKKAIINNPKINKYTCAMEYEYKDKQYLEAHKNKVLYDFDLEITKLDEMITIDSEKIKFLNLKLKEFKKNKK